MVKKTIAALVAAAVLSGAFGVVVAAAPQQEAPAVEEVAGSSWSRTSVYVRVGPVSGGGVIQLGSSWS